MSRQVSGEKDAPPPGEAGKDTVSAIAKIRQERDNASASAFSDLGTPTPPSKTEVAPFSSSIAAPIDRELITTSSADSESVPLKDAQGA